MVRWVADRADAGAWADAESRVPRDWPRGVERQEKTAEPPRKDAVFREATARGGPGPALRSWHRRAWRDGQRLRCGPAEAAQAAAGAEVFRAEDAPSAARKARPDHVAGHLVKWEPKRAELGAAEPATVRRRAALPGLPEPKGWPEPKALPVPKATRRAGRPPLGRQAKPGPAKAAA